MASLCFFPSFGMAIIFILLASVFVCVSSSDYTLTPSSCLSCLEGGGGELYCLYTYFNGTNTVGAYSVCHAVNSVECAHVGTLQHAVEGEDTGVVEVTDFLACDNDEGGITPVVELERNAVFIPMDVAELSERELGAIVDCQECVDYNVNEPKEWGWCQYEGGGYCGYPTYYTDENVCMALTGIPADGVMMTECPPKPASSEAPAPTVYPSQDYTPSGASSYCATTSTVVLFAYLLFCIS